MTDELDAFRERLAREAMARAALVARFHLLETAIAERAAPEAIL